MKKFTNQVKYFFLAAFAFFLFQVHAQTSSPAVGSTSPAGTTSPPQTNSTATGPASGDTLGATLLSYQAQEEIGVNIGKKIAKELKHKNATVYITTEFQNINGVLVQYEGTVEQLKQLQKQFVTAINRTTYDMTNKPSPPPHGEHILLFGGTGLTDAFALSTNLSQIASTLSSLLGLVSTTTTLNGVPIPPNNLGVIPVVTETLHKKHIKSSYVDFFADTSYVKERGIFHLLNADAALRTKSQTLLNLILPSPPAGAPSSSNSAPSTIQNNNIITFPPPTIPAPPAKPAPVPAPPASAASPPTFASLSADKQTDYIQLTSLNAQYDALLASIVSSNMLTSLAEADLFETQIKGHPNNYLLYVNVIYAGGNDLIKSNPIWNLFTDGPRYYYAGGAVVDYMLVDSSANTVVAGDGRQLDRYSKMGNNLWVFFLPIHNQIEGNVH